MKHIRTKDGTFKVYGDADIDKIVKVYEIVRDHKLYPVISTSFIDVESHNRAVNKDIMKLTPEEFALLKEMFPNDPADDEEVSII